MYIYGKKKKDESGKNEIFVEKLLKKTWIETKADLFWANTMTSESLLSTTVFDAFSSKLYAKIFSTFWPIFNECP